MVGVDWPLLHALNDFFARHDGIEDPVVTYVNAAEALFLVLVVGMFLLVRGGARIKARRAAVAAGAGAGLGLLIAHFVSQAVARPRPFVSDPGGVHLFSGHAADPSFPSDHATAGFAIAVAIVLRDRRWGVPVLIAAAVLAVGRVAMGLHYPSDVIAGAALGSAVSVGLWLAPARRLLDRVADRLGAALDGAAAGVTARARAAAGRVSR